jgi:hypothetical protein
MAVEQALRHFAASLEQAGFSAAAKAYSRMADVVVGQWHWVREDGGRGLEPNFLRVALLAGSVADILRPYVVAMDRLRSIQALVMDAWALENGSTAARIVASLATADEGLSVTELTKVTGRSSSSIRNEVRALVERGLVAKNAGVRYRLVGV